LPRRRPPRLTAWDAVKLVERGRREKDLFLDLSHEAAKRSLEAAEQVRRAYAEGRISYEEAIRLFKEIMGG